MLWFVELAWAVRRSNMSVQRLCLEIWLSNGEIRLQLELMVAPVVYAYCAVYLELVVLLAISLSRVSCPGLVHVSGVAKLLWRTIGPDPPEPRGGQLRPILGTAASPYSPPKRQLIHFHSTLSYTLQNTTIPQFEAP